MKKLYILLSLTLTLLLSIVLTPCKTDAKVIYKPIGKITRQYLKKHNKDTIYAICYGKRINKNGDGKDTDGFYIKYPKGKVGQVYTSIFKYKKGAVEVDDLISRKDIKGKIKVK